MHFKRCGGLFFSGLMYGWVNNGLVLVVLDTLSVPYSFKYRPRRVNGGTSWNPKDTMIILEGKATCPLYIESPDVVNRICPGTPRSDLTVSGNWSDSPQNRFLAAILCQGHETFPSKIIRIFSALSVTKVLHNVPKVKEWGFFSKQNGKDFSVHWPGNRKNRENFTFSAEKKYVSHHSGRCFILISFQNCREDCTLHCSTLWKGSSKTKGLVGQ